MGFWRAIVLLPALGTVLLSHAAIAQAPITPVKIGVLTDFSSIYADTSGKSSVLAVQMAVDDVGGKVLGRPIQIVSADFQNKSDIALPIARKWLAEDHVDLIVDAPNSAIAASLNGLVKEMDEAYAIGAYSSDLTGKYCTPNTFQFVVDTYTESNVAARELVEKGGKSWFFLTVDYALGHALERDATAVQAQSSNAQVLSFAGAGADATNLLKQAVEFGLPKNHLIAALDLEPLDVHSLGVQMLQGIYPAESWYWAQSDATRAFSKQFFEQRHLQPARGSVAIYSETMHYLKAMQAVGSDASGRAIVAKMHEMPVNDVYAHIARLRSDGRLIMDMYLVQAKTPAESKNDWDIYNILATVPGEQAFRAVSESECPLLRTQN